MNTVFFPLSAGEINIIKDWEVAVGIIISRGTRLRSLLYNLNTHIYIYKLGYILLRVAKGCQYSRLGQGSFLQCYNNIKIVDDEMRKKNWALEK